MPSAASPSATATREIAPEEDEFTGFVFKIQANMDPQHRDRIAFLRVCSGTYQPGMKPAMFGWAARSRSPMPSPSWPPNASCRCRYRATSSACTTTVPSVSATPSPRARTSPLPAFPDFALNCSVAPDCAIP